MERPGCRRLRRCACARCSEGPKYATLWDHDRKLAELQQLALQRDKDIAAYQAVVQKAWNTHLRALHGKLCKHQGRGAGAPGAA